jgi:hypothetical protein
MLLEQVAAHDHAAAVRDVVGDDADDVEANKTSRAIELDRVAEMKIEAIGETFRNGHRVSALQVGRGARRIALAIPTARRTRGIEERTTQRQQGNPILLIGLAGEYAGRGYVGHAQDGA